MLKYVALRNYNGLRWWLIQRASAVLIAVGFVAVLVYFMTHPGLDFTTWRDTCRNPAVKVFIVMVTLALALHAWIGWWTMVTDYVKCAAMRLGLYAAVILMLMVCCVWGQVIVWGV